MHRYTFPGYPGFLRKAAIELGCLAAERPAHKMTAFTSMANLCAQAGSADIKDVPAILAKAMEFRDHLHVAYRAAELMLMEVQTSLQPPQMNIETKSGDLGCTRKGRKC